MNYDLHITDAKSGESRIRQMRGEICFGRAKGPSLFNPHDEITAITYYFASPQDKSVWKEIIRTMRLGDKLTADIGEQSVTLQVEGMDRADAMRNMFILRTLGANSARVYKTLRQAGLTPRQSVLFSNACILPTHDRHVYWSTGGAAGVSPRFCTMKDFKRFLRNPQDAKGFRGGLFKDHLGKGYTTGSMGVGIISSFATNEQSPDNSMWQTFNLTTRKTFADMVKAVTGVSINLK